MVLSWATYHRPLIASANKWRLAEACLGVFTGEVTVETHQSAGVADRNHAVNSTALIGVATT
jgi:hypothetical protein